MATQLRLIPVSDPRWKLDRATIEAGRRGIAAARAVLNAHRPNDERKAS